VRTSFSFSGVKFYVALWRRTPGRAEEEIDRHLYDSIKKA
jgi:hypothetical protein